MFDFDLEKSRANRLKHGLDFVDAQRLRDDPDLLEVPARMVDEPRYLLVGRLDDRHWSGVVTYRNGTVRIISARRSRAEEVRLYECEAF